MIKASEVMDCINSIERTCNVTAWRVNGLRVWPSIRIRLSILIRDHDFVGPKVDPRTRRGPISLLEGFSNSIVNLLRLFLVPKSLHNFPAVVFTKPSAERGGLNVYSGPLQEQLRIHGIPSLAIETGDRPRRSRWREPTLPLDRFWVAMCIRAIYGLLRSFRRATVELPDFRSARRQIASRFPSVGGGTLSRHSLIREATFLEAYKRFFAFLMAWAKPRAIFIVCYYNRPGMGAILAARERHIRTVDYQHGVQGKLHYAYGRWANFPSTGYELLPDLFLVWSEAERSAIDEWAAPSPHRSVIVGNLLTQYLSNQHMLPAQNDARRSISSDVRPRVLYSLQNFIPPDWIWGAIRDTSAEMKWLIRLHPLHPHLRAVVIENLGGAGVHDYDMDHASRIPLPLLLQSIDVHVTGNSSVVLEAFQAGKPSIVIDHYGAEYYADLITAGKVALAFDPAQLRRALQRAISLPPASIPADRMISFSTFLDGYLTREMPSQMKMHGRQGRGDR